MKINFDRDNLIPMIIQDSDSGLVLSLFYTNAKAIAKMQDDGYVWRYSRKLKRVIKKGETSKNYQKVVSIENDCDSDALLVKVRPEGPACHTGQYSCFGNTKPFIKQLTDVISDRRRNPKKTSYVSSIVFKKEKIISKLREELKELIEADKKKEIIWEAADLFFFLLVYLENRDIKFIQVLDELKRRR
ncbi:phosphoribosyl-ATP diphosphatase [Candidatus Micrarchaeota archaeon]|nr:phosphoribosyl-ATP diphosphatase [Candidatus Micrarchaeota archaeon]